MNCRFLLLGSETQVAREFRAMADAQSWSSINIESFSDCLDALQFEKEFVARRPRAVINFLEFDQNCEYSAGNLDYFCRLAERFELPFIQLASWKLRDDVQHSESISDDVASYDLPLSGDQCKFEAPIAQLHKHLLLRHSWLLDGDNNSLFDRFIPKLVRGDPFWVSDHDFGTPVSVQFLARVIFALVQQIFAGANNWGVFHVHSADTCSEAEFCDHLVRQLQKELDIEIRFPSVAGAGDDRRALSGNAYLQGRRITDNFGVQLPTWRRGFARVLRDWLANNQAL